MFLDCAADRGERTGSWGLRVYNGVFGRACPLAHARPSLWRGISGNGPQSARAAAGRTLTGSVIRAGADISVRHQHIHTRGSPTENLPHGLLRESAFS